MLSEKRNFGLICELSVLRKKWLDFAEIFVLKDEIFAPKLSTREKDKKPL
jgi:hypothetical protein